MEVESTFVKYCAPMQGFTDWAWRRAHHQVFGGVDCYFAPFIRMEHGEMRRHDVAELLPERNTGVPVVPQILACKGEEAVLMAQWVRDMGYDHIDINLGCPHPPVALRHKGSGMLPYPAEVEQMLTALAGVSGVSYSVKMRLGWERPDEWQAIVPLLGIIGPTHVTVHPRTGRGQYREPLHDEQMEALVVQCPFPVIANGEISSVAEADELRKRYPTLAGVMIGRALVADPALLAPEKATAACYQQFHDLILESYEATLLGGEHQILAKMQALWQQMLPDAPHKLRKAIKKARTLAAYCDAVAHIFK